MWQTKGAGGLHGKRMRKDGGGEEESGIYGEPGVAKLTTFDIFDKVHTRRRRVQAQHNPVSPGEEGKQLTTSLITGDRN